MKAKEIDKIIYEQIGSFLKEQDGDFRIVKKHQHFVKHINGIDFCLSFSYSNYGFYRYDVILGIYIQKVEDVIKKAKKRTESLGKFTGYTYVLPLTFFTGQDVTNNIEWEVEIEEEVDNMITDIKHYYVKYIADFISKNNSFEGVSQIINTQIEKEEHYGLALDVWNYQKSLTLMKLIKSDEYDFKVQEFRQRLRDNDLSECIEELDEVVNYLDENY